MLEARCNRISSTAQRLISTVDAQRPELTSWEEGYRYQRDRLRAAEDAWWLERAEVDVIYSGVADGIDRTRTRIYSLSAIDVTEDDVETTDAVLGRPGHRCATEEWWHE